MPPDPAGSRWICKADSIRDVVLLASWRRLYESVCCK